MMGWLAILVLLMLASPSLAVLIAIVFIGFLYACVVVFLPTIVAVVLALPVAILVWAFIGAIAEDFRKE